MTICLQFITILIVHLLGSSSWAQDLVKVPVQIPAITPAVTAFTIARVREGVHGLPANPTTVSKFIPPGDVAGSIRQYLQRPV